MNNPFLTELEAVGFIVTNKTALRQLIESRSQSLQSLVVQGCKACSGLGFFVYKDPRRFSESRAIEALGRLSFSYREVRDVLENLQNYPWAPQITKRQGSDRLDDQAG